MLCLGSHPSSILHLLLLNNSSQLKISITSALLRIRTILRSNIISSKTVQGRSSSRVAICLLLSNKRITTLTTTIFKIRSQIQVIMGKEAINSSQEHSNMTTLITKTWLPHHKTLQTSGSNLGDRVAPITMLEGPPATPRITEVTLQLFPKETKVYTLSTIPHRQLKMMLPLLNRPTLRQLEEYNKLTLCPK